MKNLLLTFLISLLFVFQSIGQEEENWMEYEPEEDSTEQTVEEDQKKVEVYYKKDTSFKDTLRLVKTGLNQGDVKTQQPKMITELIDLMGTPTSPDGVQMDGYRIQIHFGQEKNEANQKRAEFLTRYDDIPVYLDYQAPNFRVRVGDFRNRIEAEKVKSELNATYSGNIVVHDKINLPRIPESQKEKLIEEE